MTYSLCGSLVAVSNQPIIQQQGMTPGEKEQYPYREARLSDAGGDLSKQWVVVYYAWHTGEKKLIRKRVRIEGATVVERMKTASGIIKEINRALKKGAHIAPESDTSAELLDWAKPEPKPIDPSQKTVTLVEAIDYYLKQKTQSLSPTTMHGYTAGLRRLRVYAEDKGWQNRTLGKITPKLLFDFFDMLNEEVENKTYNNYLLVVSALFQFYVDRETLLKNPCKALNKLPTETGGNIPFTQAQAVAMKEKMLELGDNQLWLFCALMYYTFCRPGHELRFLKVRDIGPQTILIRSEFSKSNKAKRVNIPPGLEEILQSQHIRAYPPNHYVFSVDRKPGMQSVGSTYFYKRHRKILELLKLGDHSMYAWKHSGNIAAYLAGADLMYLKDQNGHHSVSQTEQYLKDLGLIRSTTGAAIHPIL